MLNKIDKNIFLNNEVEQLFKENGFSFFYIENIDVLFAVETIIFPHDDYPFFELKGYVINNFRGLEYTMQLKMLFEKEIIKKEPNVYKFSNQLRWIYQINE